MYTENVAASSSVYTFEVIKRDIVMRRRKQSFHPPYKTSKYLNRVRRQELWIIVNVNPVDCVLSFVVRVKSLASTNKIRYKYEHTFN